MSSSRSSPSFYWVSFAPSSKVAVNVRGVLRDVCLRGVGGLPSSSSASSLVSSAVLRATSPRSLVLVTNGTATQFVSGVLRRLVHHRPASWRKHGLTMLTRLCQCFASAMAWARMGLFPRPAHYFSAFSSYVCQPWRPLWLCGGCAFGY